MTNAKLNIELHRSEVRFANLEIGDYFFRTSDTERLFLKVQIGEVIDAVPVTIDPHSGVLTGDQAYFSPDSQVVRVPNITITLG